MGERHRHRSSPNGVPPCRGPRGLTSIRSEHRRCRDWRQAARPTSTRRARASGECAVVGTGHSQPDQPSPGRRLVPARDVSTAHRNGVSASEVYSEGGVRIASPNPAHARLVRLVLLPRPYRHSPPMVARPLPPSPRQDSTRSPRTSIRHSGHARCTGAATAPDFGSQHPQCHDAGRPSRAVEDLQDERAPPGGRRR